MYGPVIEGEKMRLRPHQLDDARVFVEYLADKEVTRYLTTQYPLSLQAEQEWIGCRATDPDTLGWTIEVGGRAVGSVGFDSINWHNCSAIVGIFIGDKSLWGSGITSEIAKLLADYAFLSMPWRKIKSSFLEPNVASGRAQARIGLREVGRLHGEYFREGLWVDLILTELTREEWEKQL